jgi:hypothetical protein
MKWRTETKQVKRELAEQPSFAVLVITFELTDQFWENAVKYKDGKRQTLIDNTLCLIIDNDSSH